MSPRLLPSFSTIPVIESPRVAGLSYCHIYPAVGVVDLGIPIYIYYNIPDMRCLGCLFRLQMPAIPEDLSNSLYQTQSNLGTQVVCHQ